MRRFALPRGMASKSGLGRENVETSFTLLSLCQPGPAPDLIMFVVTMVSLVGCIIILLLICFLVMMVCNLMLAKPGGTINSSDI